MNSLKSFLANSPVTFLSAYFDIVFLRNNEKKYTLIMFVLKFLLVLF